MPINTKMPYEGVNMAKTSNKTPGVLLQEYTDKNGLQLNEVAHGIGVHTQVLLQITKGKNPITAGLALRLAKFFGTPTTFWSDFQQKYDLKAAADELKAELSKIKKYEKPAKKPGKAAVAAAGKKKPGRPAAASAKKPGRPAAKKPGPAAKKPGRAAAAKPAPKKKPGPRPKGPAVVTPSGYEPPPFATNEDLTPSFE
jgi:addiction module HigA family antidote